ncbi:hypothetical protein QVA66_03040 [Staphylococcus chromogenes]|nr:hypothetical protein [Staphylococcus chromogenes]
MQRARDIIAQSRRGHLIWAVIDAIDAIVFTTYACENSTMTLYRELAAGFSLV